VTDIGENMIDKEIQAGTSNKHYPGKVDEATAAQPDQIDAFDTGGCRVTYDIGNERPSVQSYLMTSNLSGCPCDGSLAPHEASFLSQLVSSPDQSIMSISHITEAIT
jgi:hypothetical protein